MDAPIDYSNLTGEPLHLCRARVTPSGYAAGSAYWGTGKSLFEAFNDSGNFVTQVWARTRKVAKLNLTRKYGPLKFYR